MTRVHLGKQRQARIRATELRRNQRLDDPEYRALFEWVVSTFDGRFEEICHFAVGCALDQKKLAAEYKSLAAEFADVKDKAFVFGLDANPNVTPATKFGLANYMQVNECNDIAAKVFLAGATASRKKFGADGRGASLARRDRVRMFAIEEYSKRLWKSRKEAQKTLWPIVEERALKEGWRMSEATGPETLYKWLAAHDKVSVNK